MTYTNTEIRTLIEKIDLCSWAKFILDALANGDVVHVTNLLADCDEDYEYTPDRLEYDPVAYIQWIESFVWAQHERNMKLAHTCHSYTVLDEPCTVMIFIQED